jgi:hypothetical protein
LTVATGNFIAGGGTASGKQTKSAKGAGKAGKVDEELLEKSVESVVDISVSNICFCCKF